jgi:mannose-6-phosphate isomerase-like protein (cupin superfamily)
MADFHSATMSVITNDLAPGEGPALHRHPYEEVFVVVEGEATFELDGDVRVVRGGDPPLVADPGVAHAFRNTGGARLVTVDIHASPEFVTEWL